MQALAKAAVSTPSANGPRGGRWQRILRLATTGLVALLFGLALRVLAHELRNVPPRAILEHARSIPPDRLVIAILLTCVNYVTFNWDRR